MHSATIAGKVIKVEALKGKSIGTVFHVGDQQCSPSGDVQEMAIGRYLFGAKRTEKASWLKVGENVLVHREAAGQGVVYAHQPEQLLKIGRKPSEDADIDLSGVLRSGR